MKDHIIHILAAFTVIIIGALGWHEYETFDSPRHFFYFIDLTDHLLLDGPTTESILKDLDLDSNPWSRTSVTLALITDQEVPYEFTVILEPQFKWSTQPRFRDAEIEDFTKRLEGVLRNLIHSGKTLNRSAIYQQLNRSAEVMIDLDVESHVHVFSNLAENTEIFSVYHNGQIQPDRFEPVYYAKKLTQITAPASEFHSPITFHFRPANRQESVWFSNAVEGYRVIYPNAQIGISTQ